MKHLFIVLGSNSEKEAELCEKLKIEIAKLSGSENKVTVVEVEPEDPQRALFKTLKVLRPYAEKEDEVIVVYSGENLKIFRTTMSYPKIDLKKLRKDMIYAIGDGMRTQRDKDAVAEAIIRVILAVVQKE